jgi:hypothetical protein
MKAKIFPIVMVFALLLGTVAMPVFAAQYDAAPVAAPAQAPANAPLAQKAIFFASDGMRPDLMEKYAAAGEMPTCQSDGYLCAR